MSPQNHFIIMALCSYLLNEIGEGKSYKQNCINIVFLYLFSYLCSCSLFLWILVTVFLLESEIKDPF